MRANSFGVLAALVVISPAFVASAAAQQRHGPGGGGMPAAAAPRISAPAAAPHIAAPAAPRFSAPAAAPHFAAPRAAAPAPHMAAPRFSAPAPRMAPHIAAPQRFSAPPAARFHAPSAPSAPRFAGPRGGAPHVASPRFNAPRLASPRATSPRFESRRGHAIARENLSRRGPNIANAPANRLNRQALTPENRRGRNIANAPDRLNRQAVTPNTNAGRNAVTATPNNLPNNARTATQPTQPNQRGPGRLATPGGPNRTTTGQGPGGPGRNLTSALVRSPNGRMGLRNPAFANLSARDAATRSLTRRAFAGRFAQSTATWNRDWRFRHHRHHFPFVLGFVGPLFWPYAYDDFVDYTFYPVAYDTFWPYAYDDVYEGIFGGYAPEIASYVDGGGDIYGSTGSSGASSRGARRGSGGEARMAAAPPSGGGAGGGGGVATPICTGDTQGLTDLPIQKIAQQVQPNQDQQALLDQLKAATEQALQIMQAACPTEVASTPTGRLQTMRMRVEAMLKAVQTVRPALDKFYAALTDEQKERFNALDSDAARAATAARGDVSQVCGGRTARGTDVPFARIERALRLNDRQEQALAELKDASAKAADALAQHCPADASLTPTGRLAAMEQRLQGMLAALDTVQPALAKFYDTLNDEQKAQFNRLSPRAA